MTDKPKDPKKTWREWAIFAAVIGFLYFSGLYSEVAGGMQRLLLYSGLMNAGTELPADTQKEADYNWSMRTMDGKSLTLADFKGKTVFLNVWASWCPPCIAEMPEINDLYNKVASEEIVFVMLSVDESEEKLQKFLSRKSFNFPVYRALSATPAVFGSRAIPTTFVISPAGKIVFRKEGMASYDNEDFIAFLRAQKK